MGNLESTQNRLCAWLCFCACVASLVACDGSNGARECKVGPLPVELGVDPYYTKYCDVVGVPIMGSDAVGDLTIKHAAQTLLHMAANRPRVLDILVHATVRVGIAEFGKEITEMPEATPSEQGEPAGAFVREKQTILVRESDLLCLPPGLHVGGSLVHEIAHAVHLARLDLEGLPPDGRSLELDGKINDAYGAAMAEGLWADTYAETNAREYWAEGVRYYYDFGRTDEWSLPDVTPGVNPPVDSRERLAEYDPRLHALVREVFRDDKWRPQCAPIDGFATGSICTSREKPDVVLANPNIPGSGSFSGVIRSPVPLKRGTRVLLELMGYDDRKHAPLPSETSVTFIVPLDMSEISYLVRDIQDGIYYLSVRTNQSNFSLFTGSAGTDMWPREPERKFVAVASDRRCGVDVQLVEWTPPPQQMSARQVMPAS